MYIHLNSIIDWVFVAAYFALLSMCATQSTFSRLAVNERGILFKKSLPISPRGTISISLAVGAGDTLVFLLLLSDD